MEGSLLSPAHVAERHPHATGRAGIGRVRMDSHLHTVHSGDAVTTPEQMLEAARSAALDVIAVTDHHVVAASQQMQELANDYGVRVIVGEEIRTPLGEIIGLFLTERVPYVLPLTEAAARIRDQGGLVYAPHPFDPIRSGLGRRGLDQLADAGLLDIVEVYNAKVPDEWVNEQAHALAIELGVPGAAGSDAHDPEGIGAAFVELDDFDDRDGYLRALEGAVVTGHRYAHSRRFRTRADIDRHTA